MADLKSYTIADGLVNQMRMNGVNYLQASESALPFLTANGDYPDIVITPDNRIFDKNGETSEVVTYYHPKDGILEIVKA